MQAESAFLRPGEVEIRPFPEGDSAGQTVEVVRLPLEIGGRPFNFAVILGRISEFPTDAIICGSDYQFNPPDSKNSVEWEILQAAGEEPFIEASEYLRHGHEQGFLGDLPGWRPIMGGLGGVPFTGSQIFSSGHLREGRINHIIFTNVYPPSLNGPPAVRMAKILKGALGVAQREGIASVAVSSQLVKSFSEDVEPAIAIEGALLGIELTATAPWYNGGVTTSSLVMDKVPTQSNAQLAAEQLQEVVAKLSKGERPLWYEHLLGQEK